jgi:uncharacterized protein (TIGR00269 family)
VKCSTCGETAVINMRHHKLRLCGPHYLEWFPGQVQRAIEQFAMFTRDERVLVAVSGGKDSLALWDVLLRLGYQADGVYINLGIVGDTPYSARSLEHVQAFAALWPGARYQVVDVAAEYGLSVPEAARRHRRAGKMCSLCGLIKRHIMNRMAYEGGYAAIATGHNLDDEIATLFQNTLHWEGGYLARQSPVLPATHPKLARKVKPLAKMYERESAAYALVRGIDYIYDECPYAEGAKSIFYKELFNQIENRSPGAKAQYYQQFLKAKAEGRIAFPQAEEMVLGECQKCGQPTSAGELCAFCRLWV